MIEKLSIKNFKSIKDLEINCKKINLFIGEPNTGKSNILESLGLLSWCGYRNTELKEYIRFQGTQNLFYDNLFDYPVGIKMEIKDNIKVGMEIKFADDNFHFDRGGGNIDVLDYSGKCQKSSLSLASEFSFVKFYRFVRLTEFPDKNASSLRPPHGANMFSVVMAHKNHRETMVRFFKEYGFRPVLKPMERVFEFQKQIDDVIFDYPYILLSDTLQRMIFYEIAMESNKDSTLIFEEPESHTFPYYTKHLGEKIGFDETNQYFIATHNPYFSLSILEKSPKESVNVFITYSRDYQTKVKCLTNEEISELMNYDPFFNLDSFIEEDEE